jgi:hypothetical protein
MNKGSADVGTLDEEILRSETAWGRLLSAIGRVPIDRTEEPGVCGDWSLKSLLGHIAYWDEFETEHISHRTELGEVDWEPINAAHERAVEGRTYADVLVEMKETHERLMRHIDTLRDLDPALVRELTHDHYVEHGDQIICWLDSVP